MSIFKSGSIRGTYGKEWNSEVAYRIGYHLTGILNLKTVVIGRDGRLSSSEIFEAVTAGLIKAGCKVTDVGMIDTPGLVFANIFHHFDGSVMITASHNPPSDNGMKINGKNGLVISRRNGLAELEKCVKKEAGERIPGGSLTFLDITKKYMAVLKPYMEAIGDLKCVIDCSNGMASVLVKKIVSKLQGEYIVINDTVNGNFPAHGPNPTIESNLKQIKARVVSENADLGICFDGDGDRMIVIDENGNWISPDLITAFLGLYYFKHFPEKKGNRNGVLYDARSSNSIECFIKKLGGKAYISATGHTAMQEGLPAHNGIYGGELPGHYYFSDFYNLDNGWIPFLQVLAVLSLENRPLSAIIDDINSYYFSGEINFDVPEENSIIEKLKDKYSSGKQTYLDGVRVDYSDWWFLARMANTEPVLRLVVEAHAEELLAGRVQDLTSIVFREGGKTI